MNLGLELFTPKRLLPSLLKHASWLQNFFYRASCMPFFVQPVASFEMLTRRMRFCAAVGGDAIFRSVCTLVAHGTAQAV